LIARVAARTLIAVSVLTAAFAGCRAIIGVQERELTDAGALSCESYCSLVTDVCTGAHQQYASAAICKELCATFPVGTLDDANTNTLGCRIREAEAIRDNGEVALCTAAGPGGDGICGSNCEAYCTGLEQLCASQFASFSAPDAGSCVPNCKTQIADCGGYAADATRNDDTMQCRLFHLTSAAGDAVTHCPHTIGQEGVCADPVADAGACEGGP